MEKKHSRVLGTNKLQISEEGASHLVGSIIEKGISDKPQSKYFSPTPAPKPTVLPFPVACHRSHGPVSSLFLSSLISFMSGLADGLLLFWLFGMILEREILSKYLLLSISCNELCTGFLVLGWHVWDNFNTITRALKRVNLICINFVVFGRNVS